MTGRYSTVGADEQRQNIGKIVSLAGFREAQGTDRGGQHSG